MALACGNPVCTNLLKPEQMRFCSLKCLRDTGNLRHQLGKERHVQEFRARKAYLADWQERFADAIRQTY